VIGRKDESIAEVKRALEIEPLSLITGANLVAVYLYAGRNELALEQARKTYDLDPSFLVGRYFLGLAYHAAGMYAEAIELTETQLRSDPTNQLMLRVAGMAYARSGRSGDAANVIRRFDEIAEKQYVMSYYPATIYAALGDKENAFAELEKALAERDWELHRLKVDPFMEPLRDDPRFQNLLDCMGLKQ